MTVKSTNPSPLAARLLLTLMFGVFLVTKGFAQTANPIDIFVTPDKAISGDAFVRFDNGEKQWVSAECRTILEAVYPVAVQNWPVIDALPYSNTSRSCAALSGVTSGRSGRIIATGDKAASGDAWVWFDDGKKQWIDAECRARLQQDDALPVSVLSWNEIDVIPYITLPVSCGEIVASDGGSGGGSGSSGSGSGGSSGGTNTNAGWIITTQDKSTSGDTWVEFENNEKQWVNSTCRAQLVNTQALTTQVLSWPVIDVIPYRTASLPCSSIVASANAPDGSSSGSGSGSSGSGSSGSGSSSGSSSGGGGITEVAFKLMVTSDKSTSGDGYALLTDNTRLYVSATCRASLVAAGMPVEVKAWPDIADYEQASTSPVCSTIQVSTISSPIMQPVGYRGNLQGDVVDFFVQASDADSPQLSYTLTDAPQGIVINPSNGRIVGSPTTAGNYSPIVTVSTPDGMTTQSSFTWNVTAWSGATTLPQITPIADRTDLHQTLIEHQASGSDPDGDPIRFRMIGAPDGLSINSQSGVIDGQLSVVGQFFTTVIVTDSNNRSDTTSFTWTVADNALLPDSTTPIQLTLGINDTTGFGYEYGQSSRWQTALLGFSSPSAGSDMELTLQGYDVDIHNELQVKVNGRIVGYAPLTDNNAESRDVTFFLPADTLGTDNQVAISTTRPGDTWGVNNIRIAERVTGTPRANETSRVVNPGDDLVDIVANLSSPGDVIVLTPGTHYIDDAIRPLPRQRFFCQPGAIISGAVFISSNWESDGSTWSTTGAPLPIAGDGGMTPGFEINRIRNDLFIDNQTYLRVDSLAKVNNTPRIVNNQVIYAGTFYQDSDVLHVGLGSSPNSSIVEMSATNFAFQQWDGVGDDVTIENCVIEKFATNDLEGAIDAKYTRRWLLKDLTTRFNHTGSIRTGRSTTVLGGLHQFNGQPAITGQVTGPGDTIQGYSDNVLIHDVEVAYNGWVPFDVFWHSGGIKLFGTQGLIVRDSFIHHNDGPGLWADWDVYNSHVENNVITCNSSNAVKLEAVFFGEVNNNTLACNSTNPAHNYDNTWYWGSQLFMQNSQGFFVHDNTLIADLGQGLGLVNNEDRQSNTIYGKRQSINNLVRDNIITFTARSRSHPDDGITGIETDYPASVVGLNASEQAANNMLDYNTYRFADSARAHWKFYNHFYVYTDIDPSTSPTVYPPQFSGAPWDVLYEANGTFELMPAGDLAASVLCP